ncbi:endoribonuclease Dicer-like [Amblyomma americanum]
MWQRCRCFSVVFTLFFLLTEQRPQPSAGHMAVSKVSSSFFEWTRPVPREHWDPQDPSLLEAAQPLREVEETVNYTFRDKGFMLQAFTHHTCPAAARVVPGCMRPMDFLGDAALKALLTAHLYGCLHPLSSGALTQTRARVECNRVYGFVAARHGLQRHFRSGSPALSEAIVEYVNSIGDGEYPGERGACPPKPLADLFESLACAIYLDSNQDMATLWRCLYPLLRPHVESEVARTASTAALNFF